MKIDNKKLENAIVELTVAFDVDEWKETQKKALNKLAKKVKIDGFRPGKAPVAMVKARVSKGSILEEATDMILQANFVKILNDAKVEPLAQPALNINKVSEEELEVRILVPVKPEVELGEYKGLEVKKKNCGAFLENRGIKRRIQCTIWRRRGRYLFGWKAKYSCQ